MNVKNAQLPGMEQKTLNNEDVKESLGKVKLYIKKLRFTILTNRKGKSRSIENA
jgi:hypothetical protein